MKDAHREAAATQWKEIVRVFLKLGTTAYGGPAIMGIMQAELQERRQWLSRERFVEGLALVNMLPGPGAIQLGIFLGRERGGWVGGVLAGLCFKRPMLCRGPKARSDYRRKGTKRETRARARNGKAETRGPAEAGPLP